MVSETGNGSRERTQRTVALDQSALLEVLDALKVAEVDDRIRQALDITSPHRGRTHQRDRRRPTSTDRGAAQRNGHRTAAGHQAGIWSCASLKLRAGSFFPSLLERRRRVDQALFAVVMEAYLHGVSTRKVDDLVRALGADSGISKSEVSRICADLDREVTGTARWPARCSPMCSWTPPIAGDQVNRRVVAQAVVVATGVCGDGHREVLGFAVGDSRAAFWTQFLRSLKARGLTGVQLVIADAHLGLRQAVQAVMAGAAIQHCQVHFLRNVLAGVAQGLSRDGRRGHPYHLRAA